MRHGREPYRQNKVGEARVQDRGQETETEEDWCPWMLVGGLA